MRARGTRPSAFTCDISNLLHWGAANTIAVRVDSAFNEHMLPRGRSSDWAHDGGIVRPVQLLITPQTFLERVDVEAVPDLENKSARLTITACCRNTGSKRWIGTASSQVVDEQTGLIILTNSGTGSGKESFSIEAGGALTLTQHTTLPDAQLWHFDQPNLYRIDFSISNEAGMHQFRTIFGVRKLEVKESGFYLNGERVRLMGFERMAGSNPEFGMAEPGQLITHDHDDMKHLNCVFTRLAAGQACPRLLRPPWHPHADRGADVGP